MDREFLPEKRFMLRALELAREAGEQGEVPVGAVLVREGRILSEGRNRREAERSALAHAEMEAIASACRKLGSWRLTGCQLYVTLEPCPMCAGAAVNARVERVIFAVEDPGLGCCGSAADLTRLPAGAKIPIYRGFMEEEARAVLKEFFGDLRRGKSGFG